MPAKKKLPTPSIVDTTFYESNCKNKTTPSTLCSKLTNRHAVRMPTLKQ